MHMKSSRPSLRLQLYSPSIRFFICTLAGFRARRGLPPGRAQAGRAAAGARAGTGVQSVSGAALGGREDSTPAGGQLVLAMKLLLSIILFLMLSISPSVHSSASQSIKTCWECAPCPAGWRGCGSLAAGVRQPRHLLARRYWLRRCVWALSCSSPTSSPAGRTQHHPRRQHHHRRHVLLV